MGKILFKALLLIFIIVLLIVISLFKFIYYTDSIDRYTGKISVEKFVKLVISFISHQNSKYYVVKQPLHPTSNTNQILFNCEERSVKNPSNLFRESSLPQNILTCFTQDPNSETDHYYTLNPDVDNYKTIHHLIRDYDDQAPGRQKVKINAEYGSKYYPVLINARIDEDIRKDELTLHKLQEFVNEDGAPACVIVGSNSHISIKEGSRTTFIYSFINVPGGINSNTELGAVLKRFGTEVNTMTRKYMKNLGEAGDETGHGTPMMLGGIAHLGIFTYPEHSATNKSMNSFNNTVLNELAELCLYTRNKYVLYYKTELLYENTFRPSSIRCTATILEVQKDGLNIVYEKTKAFPNNQN